MTRFTIMALTLVLIGNPALSAEFKPYPYQFEGAWGINSCQDWVMEFRRGEWPR